MFVITADQRNSRSSADAVAEALQRINAERTEDLALPAERTAGDEAQMLLTSAHAALDITLELTRTEQWSVGIGIGTVPLPYGPNVRATSGAAFLAARVAIDRAKKSPAKCAVESDPENELARDIEPLLELLILLRTRRTANGWELYDLLSTGITQADAAERLGISPQSASQRALVAGLRTEEEAVRALANLLDRAHSGVVIDNALSAEEGTS
ncbi:SatD family protein [Salinibacterium sp. SWN1162]|uniref:SatD family protein n=1 Tax=Salinibacterium sp. SWN1162 TaxID=2792053 RepID=UPI001E384D4B|nr:SatD family protein [Salinibacterium sp. SWN1162]